MVLDFSFVTHSIRTAKAPSHCTYMRLLYSCKYTLYELSLTSTHIDQYLSYCAYTDYA